MGASGSPALVTGNSVTGSSGTIGISLDDAAGAAFATMTGNTVSGFATDVEIDGTGAGVTATVGGTGAGVANSLSGATTGILVTGSDASATIEGNNSSIYGNVVGIEVSSDAGATITGNHIYDNTTGVDVTGFATLSFDTIENNATGVIVESGGTLVSATNNLITANAGDGIFIDSGAASVGAIFGNSAANDSMAMAVMPWTTSGADDLRFGELVGHQLGKRRSGRDFQPCQHPLHAMAGRRHQFGSRHRLFGQLLEIGCWRRRPANASRRPHQ